MEEEKTILLVEDNPQDEKLILRTLRSFITVVSPPRRGDRIRHLHPAGGRGGVPPRTGGAPPTCRKRGADPRGRGRGGGAARPHPPLASSGHRALAAGSGEEALALARENGGIALAVIDMILPGMNGIETSHRLCDLYPTLPVIFLTGYDNDVLAGRGIDANVLHKPIQSARLVARIREVLEGGAERG